MTGCTSRMTLPPQADRVTLGCVGDAGHYPSSLHSAQDPDGVVRRWPSDDSPAALAAGVIDVDASPSDRLPRRS